MRRKGLIQILNICAVILYLNVGVYADKGPKYGGLNIEKQYLVLLDHNDDASTLRLHPHVKDVKEIRLGDTTVHAITADPDHIEKITRHRSVRSVEENRAVKLVEPVGMHKTPGPKTHNPVSAAADDQCQEQSLVSDVYPDGTWGLIRTSHRDLPDYHTDPYVWNYSGEGVTIYLFDTGVELDHVDIKGRAVRGMHASEFETEGPEDLFGHGTHVASILTGSVYGVAKDATVVDVKVLGEDGQGTVQALIEGLAWVVADVRQQRTEGKKVRGVINMSLAYSWQSPAFYAGIQDVVDEGIPVIVAAANYAEDAAAYVPAGFNNTITVAATDIDDNYAYFSNFGEVVDIAAPGVMVTGAWGSKSYSCDGQDEFNCFVTTNGTSMATPHVVGVVARYLSSVPDEQIDGITQETIREMLTSTASQGSIKYDNNEQRRAPDRLLYRECQLLPSSPTTDPPTEPPTVPPTTPPTDPPVDGAEKPGSWNLLVIIMPVVIQAVISRI